MKRVKNTQLTKDLVININLDRLVELKILIKEYKDLCKTIEETLTGHADSMNLTSAITHILAKRSSIGTNTIEKIVVGDDTIEQELFLKSKEKKNKDDIQVVLNFIQEYQDVKKIDFTDLSNVVRKIHKNLFNNTGSSNIGKFKKNENYIPEQKLFLNPKDVEVELAKLGSFIANSSLDPIVIAAIAHAKFIEIHPFADGNGRTGRFISNKILEEGLEMPLWIDEAMTNTLNTYISSLDAFHFDGNASEIVNYFINMSIDQVHRNTSLINDLVEKASSISKATNVDYNICLYITAVKALSVAQISDKFGIHRNTAKKYLDLLVDNGYLKIKELAKHKLYQLNI